MPSDMESFPNCEDLKKIVDEFNLKFNNGKNRWDDEAICTMMELFRGRDGQVGAFEFASASAIVAAWGSVPRVGWNTHVAIGKALADHLKSGWWGTDVWKKPAARTAVIKVIVEESNRTGKGREFVLATKLGHWMFSPEFAIYDGNARRVLFGRNGGVDYTTELRISNRNSMAMRDRRRGCRPRAALGIAAVSGARDG